MNNNNLIKKQIGERINFIRKQMNMTKDSLARLINVSGQHLGKVLSGESGLSIEKIIELSQKTNYSTDFILMGKQDSLEELIKRVQVDIKQAYDEIKNIKPLIKNK